MNKQEITVELWNAWCANPITHVMVGLFKEQEDNFKRQIESRVVSDEFSDSHIRHLCYGMKCFSQMTKTMQSFDLVKKALNKPDTNEPLV